MKVELVYTDNLVDPTYSGGAVIGDPVRRLQRTGIPKLALLMVHVEPDDVGVAPLSRRPIGRSARLDLRLPDGTTRLLGGVAVSGTGMVDWVVALPTEQLGAYAILDHDVDQRSVTVVAEWEVVDQ